MGEEFKKNLLKVFYVSSFLFISIFFILPYLIQISTYFHERAHQKALAKYGIESEYTLNLLETIPNFYNPKVTKLGVTRFDFSAYEKLNKFQRTEINIAGIISDLKFIFLIGAYLAAVNVYIFYKVRIRKNYNLTICLGINWILFMWLLALVQITISNMTYSSGDIYMLVRYLRT